MANASLPVNDATLESFRHAQSASSDIRSILLRIENDTISQVGTTKNENSVLEDFNAMKSTLDPNLSYLILFCVTETETVFNGGKKWVLFVYVNVSTAKVRDKMLYSSCRMSLKTSLGVGHFVGDVTANAIDDLDFSLYSAKSSQDSERHDLRSADEMAVAFEKEQGKVESGSAAGGSQMVPVLPFVSSEDTKAAVEKYLSGEYDFVEVLLADDESFQLSRAQALTPEDNIESIVNSDEPRFILYRHSPAAGEARITVFIFSCSDNVPIRRRVMLGVAKATFVGTLENIKIDRSLEISDATYILSLLAPVVEGTESSSASQIVHSKPQRPGKNRGKVAKFTATPATPAPAVPAVPADAPVEVEVEVTAPKVPTEAPPVDSVSE
jgi:hypothetical protein